MATKRQLKELARKEIPKESRPVSKGDVILAIVVTGLGVTSLALGYMYPDSGIIGFLFGRGRFLIFWNLVALLALIIAVRQAKKKKAGMSPTYVVTREGEVIRSCDPVGTVKLGTELWMAESLDGSRIEAGRRVTVLRIDGLKLTVTAQPQATEEGN